MANSPKKVSLTLPPDLLKAAKLRAEQEGKSVPNWIADLVQAVLQDDILAQPTALDWGRIDSRIDQRTAFVDRRLEAIERKVEALQRSLILDRQVETLVGKVGVLESH
jgi:hypothetical protein